MKKEKLSKQQLRKNQINKDKKFNRIMIISFSLLFIMAISIMTFYSYGCYIRFFYHKWVWYGNEIPGKWACMNGNNLQLHKTSKVAYNNTDYYFCSQNCFNHLVKHFSKFAIVTDAISGDSINKADALIGLREKGKPELIYFKNKQTFKRYYEKNK
jgi:YHS domain-containing protein